MLNKRATKGPFMHRLLIGAFGGMLTFLLVWLLGFVLKDIGAIPGTDYAEVEARHVDAALKQEIETLDREILGLSTQIETRRQKQSVLRTGAESSQKTMKQLLEMQRLHLEKEVKPTEEEQSALAESETQFLNRQAEFEEMNQEISQLLDRQRTAQEKRKEVYGEIEIQQRAAQTEHSALMKRHRVFLAAFKLGFLVPILFAATWLILRKRASPYAPLLYACFGAAFWKTGVVIHEHFPSELFKYIAVAAGIVIVIAILVYLIRMIISPKSNWLLKQHKEAYHNGRCPVCAFPIQHGPGRYASWISRRLRGITAPASEDESFKPYTCPGCGERLYDACGHCGKVRHTLLPYCQHCGADTPAG